MARRCWAAIGIQHVVSRQETSRIARRNTVDETHLPVLQSACYPTGTVRHQQLVWSHGQFDGAVGKNRFRYWREFFRNPTKDSTDP